MTDSGHKFGTLKISRTGGDGIHIEGDVVRGLTFDEVTISDTSGHGLFISKDPKQTPTLEAVPPDQLLAMLQAFLAAAPKTQAEAEAALKPTGIERWLTKGSSLAMVATSFLNNVGMLEAALAKLMGN